MRLLRPEMKKALAAVVAAALFGCVHDEAAEFSEVKARQDRFEKFTAASKEINGAYYNCVRKSARMNEMADRSMAVEQAFLACQTEETRLRAWSNLYTPDMTNVILIKHKTALKQELTAR